jgi:succinate dehydrogenase / fumarate reductase iron-sulfur subunit
VAEVTYYVRRFDPDKDDASRWEGYRVEATPGMTVLDGLWKIKETQEPTLAWRSSCRMGICGSCAMLVNGSACLACNTQAADLGTDTLTVAPLPNFNVIRDLVPDLTPMFDTHASLHPYLIREDEEEQENPTGEYWQSSQELERYLQFSYCIKCGCCMAACPTLALKSAYTGPMPLAAAHRYNRDTRDSGFKVRKDAVKGEGGPWSCHYAGECSRVCPKGVDPAKAIQLMRRDLVLDYLRLRRRPAPSPLAGKPARIQRRAGIPEAPKPTV